MVVSGQRFAAHHDGVAGAALFSLENEADAVVRHGGFDAIRFVAHDGVDILDGHHLPRGIDHVLKQRLAADLVQHFR